MNFWTKLKLNKPFFCLAPMYDITDAAFRCIFAEYGKPEILFTEFVSADGLINEKGYKVIKKHLIYSEKERPIVAQIFGANPENMRKASKIIMDMGFDGIDINMGCPEKNINKQGAGAELINTPELAGEIIRAAKEGAGNLPVSVKTRIGYNKNEIEEWLPALLNENLSAITIHARTKKEMSKVPADWSNIARAVEIKNKMNSDTLIIGNGDVKNIKEGTERVKETGCDGVMIGRGAFGNPWVFTNYKPTNEEKLKVLVEHAKLFEKLLGDTNFSIMKKHFKSYISGFHALPACAGRKNSKELRIKLMKTNNAKEVEEVINNFLNI